MAPVLAAVGGDGRIYATDEAVALLHQAQAGDRDAFADLYHGYRDLIGRYAYVRTGDRDAAEDLIHDTFTDALIELPRADDDVVGWLLRLASRACTRHLWSQRRHLRHSLAPQVWGLLLRDGYVDDVLCGARDGDWLVTQGREILNSRESTRDVVDVLPAGPQAGQERAWALSQLVARYAQDDPAVVAFRNAHLPQGLLAWAEVERWIDAQGALDGDRTVDVTATLPAGTSVDRHPGNGRMEFTPPLRHVVGQVRFAVRTLPFAMPGDAGVRRVGVTAGGVLSRLAALAEDVAAAFAWQPAQAVVFILTGTNPYITPVRVTTPAIKVRHGHNLVATVRIQLDIDPAASPEDVLRAFEQARGNQRSTRQRAMSIKHLRLAAFAGAEHDDKPWAERHRRWNTEFPQYAYKDESNFRRDAARAIARVLNPSSCAPA